MKNIIYLVLASLLISLPAQIYAQESCGLDIKNGDDTIELESEDLTGATDYELEAEETVTMELEEGSLIESGAVDAEALIEEGMMVAAEEGMFEMELAAMAMGPEGIVIGLALIGADLLVNYLASEGILHSPETYRTNIKTDFHRLVSDLHGDVFGSMKSFNDTFDALAHLEGDAILFLLTSIFESSSANNQEYITQKKYTLNQKVQTDLTIPYFPQNMYISWDDIDGDADKFSHVVEINKYISGDNYVTYLENKIDLVEQTEYSDETKFFDQRYLLATYKTETPITYSNHTSNPTDGPTGEISPVLNLDEITNISGSHTVSMKHKIVDMGLVVTNGKVDVVGTSIGAMTYSEEYPCDLTQEFYYEYYYQCKQTDACWWENLQTKAETRHRTEDICDDLVTNNKYESHSFLFDFDEPLWIELRKLSTQVINGEKVLSYDSLATVPYTAKSTTLFDESTVTISINDFDLSQYEGGHLYLFVKSKGYLSTDFTDPEAPWTLQEFTLFRGPVLDYVPATNETSVENTHELPVITTMNSGIANSRDLINSLLEVHIPNTDTKVSHITLRNSSAASQLDLSLSHGLNASYYEKSDSLGEKPLNVQWVSDNEVVDAGGQDSHGSSFEQHRNNGTDQLHLYIPDIPYVNGDLIEMQVFYEDNRTFTKSLQVVNRGGELDRAWYHLSNSSTGSYLDYSEATGSFSEATVASADNSWLLEEWDYGLYTIAHENTGKFLAANLGTLGLSVSMEEDIDQAGTLWYLDPQDNTTFRLINSDYNYYLRFTGGSLELSHEENASTFGYAYYKEALDIIPSDTVWIQNRGNKKLLTSNGTSARFSYDTQIQNAEAQKAQQWVINYSGGGKYALYDLKDSVFLSNDGMLTTGLKTYWIADSLDGFLSFRDRDGYLRAETLADGTNAITSTLQQDDVRYQFEVMEYTGAPLDLYGGPAYGWYHIRSTYGYYYKTAFPVPYVVVDQSLTNSDNEKWLIEEIDGSKKYAIMNKETLQAIGVTDENRIQVMDWDPADLTQHWTFYKDKEGLWLYNDHKAGYFSDGFDLSFTNPIAFVLSFDSEAHYRLSEQDYLLLNTPFNEFAHTKSHSQDEGAQVVGKWNPADFEHDALKWELEYYGCLQYRLKNKHSQRYLGTDGSHLAIQSATPLSWYLDAIPGDGLEYQLRKKGTTDYLYANQDNDDGSSITVAALDTTDHNFDWLLFAIDASSTIQDLLFLPSVTVDALQPGLKYEYDKGIVGGIDMVSLENSFHLPKYATDLYHYAIDIAGYVNIPNTAYYNFDIFVNGALLPEHSQHSATLTIDGQVVNHHKQGADTRVRTIGLEEGYHQIGMSFVYHGLNGDVTSLEVKWENINIPNQDIPSGSLFREIIPKDGSGTVLADLRPGGEYWQFSEGKAFNSFPDGAGRFQDASEISNALPNNTNVVYRGYFNSEGDTYQFEVASNNSCQVFVEDELVMDHQGGAKLAFRHWSWKRACMR